MTWEYQGLTNCWQNNWIFCWGGTGKVWHFLKANFVTWHSAKKELWVTRLRAHSMAVKSASNKQPQGVPDHVQSFAWSLLILGLLLTEQTSTGPGRQNEQHKTTYYKACSDTVAGAAGEPLLLLKPLCLNLHLSEFFFIWWIKKELIPSQSIFWTLGKMAIAYFNLAYNKNLTTT